MSYTLAYQGAEIDDILGRAAPGGVIDQALAAKQDVLTFDDTPESGSDNPVKSGGIYDAIQASGAAALAAFPTDSVSGDVVSFPDGADSIPVKAFTGSILPQQNLNGQSAPYPAGGGKNLLPMTVASIKALNTAGTWSGNAYTYLGVTYTIQTDGGGNVTGIATSGTASGSSRFDIYHDATDDTAIQSGRILNGCPSGGSIGTSSYKLSVWGNGSNADAGSGVTIYAKNEWCSINVYNGTNVSGKTFYPMIRLSSVSDATFAPYSNICPISGWTGANVYRTGVNVWDEDWEVGGYNISNGEKTVDSTRIRCANPIPVVDGESYYALFPSGASAYRLYYDATGAYVGNSGSSIGSGAFTVPSGVRYITFYMNAGYGTTYGNNISINYPSTVTTYQPYNGSAILLDFGQTVYAGTLTALGGGLWKIQATKAYATISTINGSKPNYYATVSQAPDTTNQLGIICDKMKTSASVGADGVYINANRAIMFRTSDYESAADLLTAFGGSVNICYPLATLPDPITITGEDLQTLLGANTVWTDCGSVTGMTYRADTALYIQKLIGGGGTLQTLSMASPSPSLSLGRVGVLAEPEVAEPEQTDEEAEQLEQTEEAEQAEEE